MKVFVTGGTGFVGSEVIRQLLAASHEVRALVRKNSAKGTAHLPKQIEFAPGDVLDADLAHHLKGAEAVIHLVGIIRPFPKQGITFSRLHVEATRNLLAAMKNSGLRRLVHMSALGAGPHTDTQYFRTKWEAETRVRESGLAWTVMKPSVIFGPQDEFVNLLARQVKMLPVVPVIGEGEYLLQPVSVRDVAAGFVAALSLAEAEGKAYEIAGPDRFTYNALLDEIGRALGKERVRKLHLPLSLMRPTIRALEGLSFFPITSDQLTMLLMNNVGNGEAFFRDFSLTPLRLPEGIREYLR